MHTTMSNNDLCSYDVMLTDWSLGIMNNIGVCVYIDSGLSIRGIEQSPELDQTLLNLHISQYKISTSIVDSCYLYFPG